MQWLERQLTHIGEMVAAALYDLSEWITSMREGGREKLESLPEEDGCPFL